MRRVGCSVPGKPFNEVGSSVTRATIAQSVEQPPCKRQVGSPILPGGFSSASLLGRTVHMDDRRNRTDTFIHLPPKVLPSQRAINARKGRVPRVTDVAPPSRDGNQQLDWSMRFREMLDAMSNGEGVRELSETERAWLAGVIDGEGSIGLYRSTDGRRVVIQVGNTHRGFIERVREVVGCGSISPREPRGLHKGRKTVYHYTCTGAVRGFRLLEQVTPYLVIKKSKAEEIMHELRTRPFGIWIATTPEARATASRVARESWRDPSIRARRIEGLRRHFEMRKVVK